MLAALFCKQGSRLSASATTVGRPKLLGSSVETSEFFFVMPRHHRANRGGIRNPGHERSTHNGPVPCRGSRLGQGSLALSKQGGCCKKAPGESSLRRPCPADVWSSSTVERITSQSPTFYVVALDDPLDLGRASPPSKRVAHLPMTRSGLHLARRIESHESA